MCHIDSSKSAETVETVTPNFYSHLTSLGKCTALNDNFTYVQNMTNTANSLRRPEVLQNAVLRNPRAICQSYLPALDWLDQTYWYDMQKQRG